MTNKTIGDLTARGAAADADLFEVEQSGNSRKETRAELRASMGGAMTLIETLSPSGAASIDSEAFAGGGYKELLFVINITVSNDDVNLQVRFKLNGAYKTSTDYRRVITVVDDGAGTPTSTAISSNATSVIQLSASSATKGIGNATAESYSGELRVFDPDSTTKPKKTHILTTYVNSAGQIAQGAGAGIYTGTDSAAALQGVRFLISAGTMTGTIKVFGLK